MKSYPLTQLQRTIYFNYLQNMDPELYHNQYVLQIKEPLDSISLEKAWNKVLIKHPALRHTFYDETGQIFQKCASIVWKKIDFFQDSNASHLENYRKEKRSKLLDLSKDHLVYLALFQFDSHDFRLILGFHHLIMDGWSAHVVMQDLFDYYFLEKNHPSSPNLAFHHFLEGGFQSHPVVQELQEADSSPVSLAFLGNHDQPSSPHHLKADFGIFSDFRAKILYFCKAQKITAASLITGLIGYLLGKISQREEAILGLIISGRNIDIKEVDLAVGVFIRVVPLHITWKQEERLIDFIKKIQTFMVRSQDPQKIEEGSAPMLDCLVSSESYHPNSLVEGRNISLDHEFDKSHDPLVFNSNVTLEGSCFQLYGNSNFFHQDALETIKKTFLILLEQAVNSDPTSALGDLQLCREAETEEILNASYKKNLPPFPSICDFLQLDLESKGSCIAIKDEIGSLSYQELSQAADNLAWELHGIGLTPKCVVALICNRSCEAVTAMTALWKMGIAFIPIDSASPRERVELILKQGKPHAVLYNENSSEINFDFTGTKISFRMETKQGSPFSYLPNPPFSEIAYIIFSSGTSGSPKLTRVAHSSLNVLMKAWEEYYKLSMFPVRLLQIGNFGFDVFIGDWLKVLMTGGTLIMLPDRLRSNPQYVVEWIIREDITILESTPSFVRFFLSFAKMEKDSLCSLKLIILGSEACHKKEAESFYQDFGHSIRFVNGYGLTEAAIETAVFEINPLNLMHMKSSLLAIGRPLNGQGLYVLDKNKQILPKGVIGKLFIGGSGVPFSEQENSHRYCQNPYTLGLLYDTGDLAAWNPHGFVEFCGRTATMVKLRGYRVDLNEIENAMLDLPLVQKAVAAIFSIQDTDALALFICTNHDFIQVEKAALDFLNNRFPSYMIPLYIKALAQLPLNVNGKIDRIELSRFAKKRSQEIVSEMPTGLSTKGKIIEIWESILNMKIQNFERSFFDYRGNSIQILQLYEKLVKEFQIEFSITELFSHPSIESQREFIEKVMSKEKVYG